MRLGGPLLESYSDPGEWVSLVKKYGYSAAYCPVGLDADTRTIHSYQNQARKNDIVIAEVGAWSNPLSPDGQERKRALEKCIKSLALADEINARCCVNISGSRGRRWDGPHPENLTRQTFEAIVEVVRKIIDAVKPKNTFYTLETMPWMYPDSVASYQALLKAVDRKSFAVHFDPVNLINSPSRYYQNRKIIQDFVRKLGCHIRSCHAKDTILLSELTVHLKETRPGCGYLDYGAFLQELNSLDPDTPLMLEHLSQQEEYQKAASFIREKAAENNILFQ